MIKKFWITPPELWKKISDEFGIVNDVCPFPLPDNFDCLKSDWSSDYWNFVNPPFRKSDGNGNGPTSFVRKAIDENKRGKKSIIIIPTQSYVNLLLEAGAELRSLVVLHGVRSGPVKLSAILHL